jgi:hypothetical protein
MTEVETIIEPDGLADNVRRESVALVCIHLPILSNQTSLFVSSL